MRGETSRTLLTRWPRRPLRAVVLTCRGAMGEGPTGRQSWPRTRAAFRRRAVQAIAPEVQVNLMESGRAAVAAGSARRTGAEYRPGGVAHAVGQGLRVTVELALPTWPSLVGMTGLGQAGGMTPEPTTYPGYRFPAEIISHALWLYHVFGLSPRDVELILAERGIGVSHESIRQWCLEFGGDVARRIRRRRPRPGDTWHMDEVYLRINGVLHYLWRAVDQHGVVLDILVQDRRNTMAAKMG
jgi:hypothetical protein